MNIIDFLTSGGSSSECYVVIFTGFLQNDALETVLLFKDSFFT